MPLSISAHAKVNLHLEVGPRRRDGYHTLKTLFQEISLHDELTFEPTLDGDIEFVGASDVPSGDDNIVVKALKLLKKQIRTSRGMRVTLNKKIPMGAGLGGGSSDAAAALKAGWVLWKNPRAKSLKSFKKVPPVLMRLAAKLGADVPFFLRGGTAWAGGIGEILTYQKPQPKQWMVLVYPRVHVSTPQAYKMLDQLQARNRRAGSKYLSSTGKYFNSFETVIFKTYRAVAKVKQVLLRCGCQNVLMSGSGSSVFGMVASASEGARVLNQLQPYAWDTFLVHTL